MPKFPQSLLWKSPGLVCLLRDGPATLTASAALVSLLHGFVPFSQGLYCRARAYPRGVPSQRISCSRLGLPHPYHADTHLGSPTLDKSVPQAGQALASGTGPTFSHPSLLGLPVPNSPRLDFQGFENAPRKCSFSHLGVPLQLSACCHSGLLCLFLPWPYRTLPQPGGFGCFVFPPTSPNFTCSCPRWLWLYPSFCSALPHTPVPQNLLLRPSLSPEFQILWFPNNKH